MAGDLDKIELENNLYKYVAMEAYIYMIELNDMIYFGSTIDMKMRQRRHNFDIRNGCDSPIYKYCRENDINKLELILLECVPIEDRRIVEQYYIDLNKGDKLLNCLNATFDKNEYNKAYHQANKEQIKEQKKIIYPAYYEANKEKYKEYYQANREMLDEKQRLRRARKKAESN